MAAEGEGVKGRTEVQEPSRTQQAIARRTAEARATVPDIELSTDVELERALTRDEPLLALLVRACALALREVPLANGSYRDGRFELHSRVNVGVLIEMEGELVVPTLFDADRKSPAELAAELEALRERAQAGELTSPELSGATFTLEQLSVDRATPIIRPPQAAAIAAGRVRETPIARDGAILPGRMLSLTLACDHRILYGALAARFLTTIEDLLEVGSL
jgi:pyruvate dehydrogenase E2 component (dihydrolipoamide acetyltransferase)